MIIQVNNQLGFSFFQMVCASQSFLEDRGREVTVVIWSTYFQLLPGMLQGVNFQNHN